MISNKYTKTIKPTDRVLDLGSGHNPHPLATVCVDYFIDNNWHRDGQPLKRPEKAQFINWNLNKFPYPFADKEFDFVIAAQIAEHLDDPFNFCREVQRIGKRGYIETPSKFYEQLYGWEFHQWYVSIIDNRLVFENINKQFYSQAIFGEYIHDLYHKIKDERFRKLHDKNIEKLITAFYWEKSFNFTIIYNSFL